MNWEKMDSAPRDGSYAWLLVRPLMLLVLDSEPVPPRVLLLARYDSWNFIWRIDRDGEFLAPPKWHMPELWQKCILPELPPEAAQ